MKILVIECTAEELKANRTIMDTMNDVLNNFTDNLCGVNNIDFVKAMANADHDGCDGCAYEDNEPYANPCNMCKQNYTDKFEYESQ